MSARAGKPTGKPDDRPSDAMQGKAPARDDTPVIPERSSDDSDEGWERSGSDDSDDERYLRDRPPHWQ